MNTMRNVALGVVGVAALAVGGLYAQNAWRVHDVVAQNAEARGGDAWEEVETLRLTGRMELADGVYVPYILEQKAPNKLRIEFEVAGETAVQATDGDVGWKLEPYLGHVEPERLSLDEAKQLQGFADPRGPLLDPGAASVWFVGTEDVDGKPAHELLVTLRNGVQRRVWLDAETGLEVRMEAERELLGKRYVVETTLSEWHPTRDGLLVARKQDTRTRGDRSSHGLTVDTVQVNPEIDDSRFTMPM
jgi:hypothetical protein